MASLVGALEAVGGRIEVESETGSGTLFRCVVPDQSVFDHDEAAHPQMH